MIGIPGTKEETIRQMEIEACEIMTIAPINFKNAFQSWKRSMGRDENLTNLNVLVGIRSDR